VTKKNILETFENPHPQRDYQITSTCPEFTCVCPKTGQPDFATIVLEYVPDAYCVELKSLKLYLHSFRNDGHFHEDVTNCIANDLIELLTPRKLKIVGKFNKRGGIHTDIEVNYP